MDMEEEKKKGAGTTTEKIEKSYFDVLGLCCSAEVPLIEKIINSLDGVKDVSVIVPTRTVIVVHDSHLLSQLQIVKALNQARLEANVRASRGEKDYKKKWPSPYAVACGVLLLASFLKLWYDPLKWLAIGAVAVGIIPILLKAYASLRLCSLDINILMLIAVAGSIALEDYWEAGTIVFLFTTAEWLEARAGHKATSVMSSLVNVVPQRAILADTHEEVNADEVKLNTVLAVKAGETVPIDGVVVDGNCEMDEKTLTGESFPVAKQKDSTVWAGTLNLNGYISIKTTAVAEDCVVARMAKLVEDAQNNKSATQRFIDKCAKYYTPAVIAISASFAIVPLALRVRNMKDWYRLALVILVSACPCALILSTPVAMFCALSKAATSGLLFKGAEYLETLAKIKITAFDKTGTITRGEFIVSDFRSLLEDVSLETMLYWVSSIESKSSHPMAAAVIDFAQFHSVTPKPDKVEQFQNFPGEGIYGKIEGKDIYVGNRRISSRAGCVDVPTLEDEYSRGKSIGFIFLGSNPAGFFSLSDVCRTGAEDALKELKQMGIRTAMLTGDSHAAAIHAQSQLVGALDVVHAELLPEDKARIIQQFQKEGPTAMIGDGLNDAPALATADIGISMGISGSALATETGNVILMSNDVRKIPKAVRLARRVRRKVIENVILAISTKSVIVALAIAGHPLVWAAVLADVGTCLLVILNSMLLLRGTHRHGGKCCKTSASSHIHKHNSKHSSHRSSHTHQACCSDKGSDETAAIFQFDASHSCQKDTCSESTEKHVFPSHATQLNHDAKSHGHGTCSAVKRDPCGGHDHSCLEPIPREESVAEDHSHTACNTVEGRGPCGGHDHGCLELAPEEQSKCSDSIQRYNGCAADGEIHSTDHCGHINHSTVTSHNHPATSEVIQHHVSNNSCQVKCCNNNSNSPFIAENIGNVVRICGNHTKTKQDILAGCKGHGAECGAPVRSTINILRGNNHVHCTGRKACPTLEKRQVGGCCRKECCPKSSHFGTGFGGSLSEIVIE